MMAVPTTATSTRCTYTQGIMHRRAISSRPWARSPRSELHSFFLTVSHLCVLRYLVEAINEYEGMDGHDDNVGINTLRNLLNEKKPIGSRDTYKSLPKERNAIARQLFVQKWLAPYVRTTEEDNRVEVLREGNGDRRASSCSGTGELASERGSDHGMPYLYGSCRWRTG